MNTSRELTEKYAQKIEPILPLAKRAYGLRGQDTPEHKASTKYTELVKDYYSKGGVDRKLTYEGDETAEDRAATPRMTPRKQLPASFGNVTVPSPDSVRLVGSVLAAD